MDQFWRRPLRIIQNNLRAIDAENMDVEALIRTQAEYGTNVMIANAGGLLCWYDSEISRQPRNPFLKCDYVKEIVECAHKRGMRVLLRLDVSNLSEKDLKEHPDWLRRDTEGQVVVDLGMPQSCIFSPMWQEYNFQLIDELMAKYKPDGLFYNANHFGFCHCDRCREHYRVTTGHELPDRLLVDTEEGREYMRYRYEQMAAYFSRVRDAIRKHNPDAVLAPVGSLCTERPIFNSLSGWDGGLFSAAQDIQVSETVNHVQRPQPYWTYLVSENASASNAVGQPAFLCIHQACQLGRNAVTPPAQYVHDIYEAASFGGGPAINMIGTFRQEDRKDLLPLRTAFNFLRDNEDCYTDLRQKSRVMLLYSQKTNDYDSVSDQTAFSPSGLHNKVRTTACGDEYRGVYETLAHNHIPFEVMHDGFLAGADLSRYEAIILAGVTCLDDAQSAAIDRFVERGGRLIVTGNPPTKDGEGRERGMRLKCLPYRVKERKEANGYLLLENKALYPSLPDTDLIGFQYGLSILEPLCPDEVTRDMRHRCSPANNKPEFCYIADMTDEYGLFCSSYRQGQTAVLPWALGRLYRNFSIYECPRVMKDLLARMGLTVDLETDAPYTVETVLCDTKAGETLALINGAGATSKVQLECVRLHGLSFRVRTTATKAVSRVAGREYPSARKGEFLTFTVPQLDDYDLIVLEKE